MAPRCQHSKGSTLDQVQWRFAGRPYFSSPLSVGFIRQLTD